MKKNNKVLLIIVVKTLVVAAFNYCVVNVFIKDTGFLNSLDKKQKNGKLNQQMNCFIPT